MDKTVRVVLTGVDQSASRTMTGVGAAASKMTAGVGSSLGKLGGMVGGELGAMLDRTSMAFDHLGARGSTAMQKLTGAGLGIVGVGAVLTQMGSKEQAASQQLDQAIQNTGKSTDDFSGRIEQTVKHMEHYGDSAVSTKTALTTLTNATHDPEKALNRMQVAADLAAASHISLDSAATQVAKALGGSGRIFKTYGIQVQTNTDGTKDYAGAVDQLGKVLSGQASAASNTLMGHLKALGTEAEDGAAKFGQKYGPAITAVGASITVLGPIVGKLGDVLGALGAKFAGSAATAVESNLAVSGSTVELTSAVETSSASVTASVNAEANAVVVADAKMIGANEKAAASFTKVGTSSKVSAAESSKGGMGMVGMLGTTVAVTAAVGALSSQINGMIEKSRSGSYELGKLGQNFTNLNSILVNDKGSFRQASDQWLQAQLQASGLADKAAKAGISLKDMTDDIEAGAQGTQYLIDKWKATGKPSSDTIFAVGTLGIAYAGARAKSDALGKSTDDLASKEMSAADKVKMQGDQITLLTDALNGLGQGLLAADGSENTFLDGLDKVTQSFKDNGASIDQNTTKGRANREVMESSLSEALSHAQAMRKNGDSIDSVTHALNGNVAQLVATAIKAGASKSQVDALVKSMGLTPKQINTNFNINTRAAYDAIATLTGKAEYLAQLLSSGDVGGYLDISVRNQSQFGGGGHSGGSEFYEGGRTVVGERGAEVVDLPRGSRIHPAESHVMSSGSANRAVVVNIYTPQYFGGSSPELVRQIIAAIETHVGAGGKIRALAGLN